MDFGVPNGQMHPTVYLEHHGTSRNVYAVSCSEAPDLFVQINGPNPSHRKRKLARQLKVLQKLHRNWRDTRRNSWGFKPS